MGIVLGQKANFSKTFQQYLSTTGIMHVIAASGMNVTMLAGFLFGLFGLLFQRRVAIAGSVIGIVCYMILAGLQASILRAGIMAIIAFSGQMLGRQYTALYGLALTCLGLLLWNPILITDIGFQLSVGATLGIIFIKPLLFHTEALEDINTTIAAQLATLPILLTSFGTYGLASILVNTLVLWTIPLITILGGIGAIISFIFPFLGNLLITLSIPLLWWFETVIIFFGKLGWNIQVQSLNWEIVVGYYLSLIGTIYFFDKKKSLE